MGVLKKKLEGMFRSVKKMMDAHVVTEKYT
jgi:hypothetical protein